MTMPWLFARFRNYYIARVWKRNKNNKMRSCAPLVPCTKTRMFNRRKKNSNQSYDANVKAYHIPRGICSEEFGTRTIFLEEYGAHTTVIDTIMVDKHNGRCPGHSDGRQLGRWHGRWWKMTWKTTSTLGYHLRDMMVEDQSLISSSDSATQYFPGNRRQPRRWWKMTWNIMEDDL